MNPIEQQFFNNLEKKLWTAADKLRSNLDAAVYKHVVLGLIFLKYVSDAFEERQKALREQFQNPGHDYYMSPEDYPDDYAGHLAAELEVRDYYTEKNVFWVPLEARWQTLRDCAQLPPKAPLPWNKPGKDEPEDMRSVGWLIDNAMEAIERENEKKLKNVLNKDFARTQIDSHKLADLIAHFSDTDFKRKEYNGQPLDLKSKDILGHVYEYFLGQFALAEGKKGGQYYTPKSIVTLIVEMLQPFKGRVYDPAMGSGGFFVQSEEFIEQHGGKVANGNNGPDQRLRSGEQSHHLASGRHEHGHSRHRLQLWRCSQRYAAQRSASRPARRLRHGQPALQHEGVVERKARQRPALDRGHTAAGQRQLRLVAAHALPPGTGGQYGPAAGQRLNEQQHQQ
jgi:type I restriction enzyme M protein